MSRTKTLIIFTIIAVLLFVGGVAYYDLGYPSKFQINGSFSTRFIGLDATFDRLDMNASRLLFTTLMPDDVFNLSMEAERGWRARQLIIWNDTQVLLDTNGSFSLSIREPDYFFLNSQNTSFSVVVGKTDSVFFNEGDLVTENVTVSTISLQENDVVMDFQVGGGNVSVIGVDSVSSYENENGRLGILLDIDGWPQIVTSGKFSIQTNPSSAGIDSIYYRNNTVSFTFPRGFLDTPNSYQQLWGSQNLNLTDFKGSISVAGQGPSQEATIHGECRRTLVGQVDVTGPDFIRDVGRVLGPYSALLLIPVSVFLSAAVNEFRNLRKEKRDAARKHLEEFKDYFFAPFLRNLEEHFDLPIRLRSTGRWTFLRGLVDRGEHPLLEPPKLEESVSKKLLLDADAHFPVLQRKIEDFKQVLKIYNESYLKMAQETRPFIENIKSTLQPNLTLRMIADMNHPKDKGGMDEWAFFLLLGASEKELEHELDISQKDEGLQILRELEKKVQLMSHAAILKTLHSNLEKTYQNLKLELETLLRSDTINGKCSATK